MSVYNQNRGGIIQIIIGIIFTILIVQLISLQIFSSKYKPLGNIADDQGERRGANQGPGRGQEITRDQIAEQKRQGPGIIDARPDQAAGLVRQARAHGFSDPAA